MIPDIIFKQTYSWEKGFGDIEEDLGGLTNDGITYDTYVRLSQIVFKKKPNLKHFSNLSMSEKKQMYSFSWYIVRCDDIENIAIAGLFFDFNFNSDGAEKATQRFLNEKYGYSLEVDGIVGKKTIAAINGASQKDLKLFINNYQDARTEYVKGLVRRRPTQQKFLKGWTNRIEDWRKFALSLITV